MGLLAEVVVAGIFFFIIVTQCIIPTFRGQPIFPKFRKAPTLKVEEEIRKAKEDLEAERLKDEAERLQAQVRVKRNSRIPNKS